MLNPSARKSLRKQAHHLKPTVFVGKDGMSQTVIAAARESLDAHELIKVRFVSKKEISAQLAELSESDLVGMIGHLAILYRQHPDEARRKVQI